MKQDLGIIYTDFRKIKGNVRAKMNQQSIQNVCIALIRDDVCGCPGDWNEAQTHLQTDAKQEPPKEIHKEIF